jgi:hypothetical protein
VSDPHGVNEFVDRTAIVEVRGALYTTASKCKLGFGHLACFVLHRELKGMRKTNFRRLWYGVDRTPRQWRKKAAFDARSVDDHTQ